MTENTKENKKRGLTINFKKAWQNLQHFINERDLSLIHCIMCFLLCRSSISGELFPCSIAFVTAYFYLKGPNAIILILSILGIISVRIHLLYILAVSLIYLYFYKFKRDNGNNIFKTAGFFSLILYAVNVLVLIYDGFSINVLLINTVEIIFIISAAYIFKEAIRYIDNKSYNKSLESVSCIMVAIFLCVLGLNRISVYGFDMMESVKYFTIVFISVYLSPLAGMVMALSFGAFGYHDLSQAAFYMIALGSGALSTGLLNDNRKLYSPILFIAVSSMILLYFKSLYLYEDYMIELGVFAVLFMIIYLTYNTKLKRVFNSDMQVVEKDETYNRLTKLSDAINEISVAYEEEVINKSKPSNLIDQSVDIVYSNICMECDKCNVCWKKNYNKTYYAVTKTANNICRGKNIADKYIKNECKNSREVIRAIYKSIKKPDNDAIKQEEIKRSKEVVASSLKQTSEILNETAAEILYVDINSQGAKDRIKETLLKNGIKLKYIECSKVKGLNKIKISISTSKQLSIAVNIIADTVKSVTGLNIKCTEKLISSGTYYILQYEELEKINVKAFYSKLAKENNDISGDSYSYGSCNDRFYSILCDGMGTGIKASKDSKEAIELLNRLFEADFNEKRMLNTLNSLLLLKFEEDRYVTLDMSVINLEDHELRMYKAGAAPTYILSNKNIKKYESNSLPIGILDEFDYYYNSTTMKKGDTVIMMTDGILDSINEDESKSLDKYIESIQDNDPQTIANSLLAYAVSGCKQIIDDMTIIVLKIV